ncbi:MAG: Fe-S protein assembly co-chaperone HscB [Bacteroidota bacterium]|jgi:molecular chaperone HscB
MNYFEWFGIPVSPRVDMGQVTRKYMEMQRKFHPDYHADASEEEQQEMLEKTSELNKAYALFKDVDATIVYFLETVGLWKEGQKESLSPAFLMEMMELNESLDEGDDAVAKGEILSKIEAQNRAIEPILLKNNAELSEKDTEQIILYLNQKKYLKRILERLSN